MDSITDSIMQEISSDDIQKVMDSTLKGQSFDFSEYIGNIINGQSPFSFEEAGKYILEGIRDNIVQEKKYIHISGYNSPYGSLNS